jgi:hypothetical protein
LIWVRGYVADFAALAASIDESTGDTVITLSTDANDLPVDTITVKGVTGLTAADFLF